MVPIPIRCRPPVDVGVNPNILPTYKYGVERTGMVARLRGGGADYVYMRLPTPRMLKDAEIEYGRRTWIKFGSIQGQYLVSTFSRILFGLCKVRGW